MSASGSSRRNSCAAALFTASLLAVPSFASGEPSSAAPLSEAPFRGGESLKYQLRWLGIPLASVRLSADGPIDWKGKRVFRYRARLKSIGLLTRLYRVDDHAVSLADAQGLFSYRFDLRQKEGSYRAERWNIYEKNRTVYGRGKRPPRYYGVFGELSDVLSAVYKARSFDLRPGQEADIYVFQGKYLYHIYLKVTGTELIDTLWGPIRTLVIRPRIAGKSRLNDQATTWLWVTADKLHIPVRLESRTYLGPVVAHLVESRGVLSGRLAKAPGRKLKRWKPKTIRVEDRAGGAGAYIKKLLNKSKKRSSNPDTKTR